MRAAAERAAKASRKVNDPDAASDDDEEDESEDEDMPEAGPSTVRQKSQSKADSGEDEEMGEDGEGDAEAGEQEEEGAEAAETQEPIYAPPPKIMITTSPSPCKLTYNFCDALKSVFPGGQFFKRPRGKGFELGRLARWGIKRGFGAVIIVNEDHKQPSKLNVAQQFRETEADWVDALTLINLPAGPTAYFRLTSIQMGDQIAVSSTDR